MWWESLLVAAIVLVAVWLALVLLLVITRPSRLTIKETLRLVPDLLRLIRRLATDRTVSRRARVSVWLLLVYLASPIDVIPDFVPVVGYADDVILTAFVLRRFVRSAGWDKVREHWPGSDEGLAALQRLLRL